MRIRVAEGSGFCFGVDRAVNIVEEQLALGKRICTIGELIHNPGFVRELAEKGARAVEGPGDIADGETAVIRAHGVPPEIYGQLKERGVEYIDATCPFVLRIHRIVESVEPDGGVIFIAGDALHPEIIGITGHCRAPYIVFESNAQLEEILEGMDNIEGISCYFVAQTTFSTREWLLCADTAKKVCTKPKIFDTICNATVIRQERARELAESSGLMVVVGGKHSSNTQKLYDICKSRCRTILVESAHELMQYDLGSPADAGVAAGASTPVRIIKEVQQTMSEILKNSDEMSFEEMLDQSFKNTYTGEKVTAVVTRISPNEIVVDIGTKQSGYVPISELTSDPTAKPEDIVKVGDEIELIVTRVNDIEGIVTLSKKRVDAMAGFEKVMAAVETGEVFTGVVVEVVKGGLLALTSGIKVFIPASQATASRNEDSQSMLKKQVQFKILEVNRARRRAVGSIRAIEKEKRKALESKFWDEVEVNKTYTGKVKSLTSYGAFVDLGGVDGMVHISELSWKRIKHPSEVVSVGEELEVYVKDIDQESKKISLGYKKSSDNPWEQLRAKHNVGDVITVKIVSMTAFGAFAQILPGVDGLIHISEISTQRIAKPQDVLSVSQEVEVKITELNFEKKRVSLSMKALLAAPSDDEAAAPAPVIESEPEVAAEPEAEPQQAQENE